MSRASIGFMMWRVSSRDSKNTNPATTTSANSVGTSISPKKANKE